MTIALKYLVFFLLAKVGVEGSNPFARSSPLVAELSPPNFEAAKKPNVCRLFCSELEALIPKRTADSLSEEPFVSKP